MVSISKPVDDDILVSPSYTALHYNDFKMVEAKSILCETNIIGCFPFFLVAYPVTTCVVEAASADGKQRCR